MVRDLNSPVTRLRRWLSSVIEPKPADGEAWCMNCKLNQGRSLVLSTAGAPDHVERHHREDPGGGLFVIRKIS